MAYVIVGLGNPEASYETTRHNIGFRVVDRVADRLSASFTLKRYAHLAEARHQGRVLCLLKPTTYMNHSGKAVRYYLSKSIPLSHLLVIVDDLALPFAKLRLRGEGSAGGHNGLEHIAQSLETASYARLRFGIGDAYPKGAQSHYVLSPFTTEEEATLSDALEKAAEMVLSFCTRGLSATMNQYH